MGSWDISLALKPNIMGVAGANMQWGHFVCPGCSQKREKTVVLRSTWGVSNSGKQVASRSSTPCRKKSQVWGKESEQWPRYMYLQQRRQCEMGRILKNKLSSVRVKTLPICLFIMMFCYLHRNHTPFPSIYIEKVGSCVILCFSFCWAICSLQGGFWNPLQWKPHWSCSLLLLQKPHAQSKNKENVVCLQRCLSIVILMYHPKQFHSVSRKIAAYPFRVSRKH